MTELEINRPLTRVAVRRRRILTKGLVFFAMFSVKPATVGGFLHHSQITCRTKGSKVHMAEQGLDDIAKLQAKARTLLEKSKAKLAESPENESGETLPFFAAQEMNGSKREAVIKSTTTEGLITTDGELMAALSEKESWEVRGLLDVFESETKRKPDRLADRDVAASIYNLRKVLQNEDYKKIFDKRNRWIGEDN